MDWGSLNIGLANAKMICREFDYDLERIRHATVEELTGIDGIGEVIGQSLVSYFEDERNNRRLDRSFWSIWNWRNRKAPKKSRSLRD